MPIEELVEDWDNVKKRWEAWWAHDLLDRVVISITAPKDGVTPAPTPAVDVQTPWTDAGYMVHRTLEANRTTYFGGEALPVFNHGWSAGHTLFLGCQPHFAPDTVWVDPAPVGEDGYPHFGEEWRDSPWWRWMLETTRTAAQASQGRYFMQSLWGNAAGDTLALARGTQNLLLDIAAHPAWVKSAVQRVSDILIEAVEAVWQIMGPGKLGVEGSLNYVGCWSPVRTSGLDCDFSCMISPRAFKELFLPPLIETMATFDHRIYHLDGPGAIPHLEALLALPELHAIQWVPGAGQEAIRQWIPLIQRVQRAGKSIAVQARPEEIDLLLDEVRPEGLFITTSCASEGEGRALLERLARR
jgi:hypothetical protein